MAGGDVWPDWDVFVRGPVRGWMFELDRVVACIGTIAALSGQRHAKCLAEKTWGTDEKCANVCLLRAQIAIGRGLLPIAT